MLLSQLPTDIFQAICSFLSGFEVFGFSHVNSRALYMLSDNLFWRKRLQSGEITTDFPSQPRQWKQRYMQARSLQFADPESKASYLPGLLVGDNRARLSFAKLEQPPPAGSWRGGTFEFSSIQGESFSFDVWFCVFPATINQDAGGAIYGLQPSALGDRAPVFHPCQFVLVDAKRNLVCSVIDEQKPVAQDIKTNCWYHLALTYDFKLQRQDVYLDGENVWSTFGSLITRWSQLANGQIGNSGFNTFPSILRVRFPRVAWYPFHGLIDEFRVWKGDLSAEATAELTRGGIPDGYTVLGSMKRERDGRGLWKNTKAVRCTRPAEGKNVIIQQTKTTNVKSSY